MHDISLSTYINEKGLQAPNEYLKNTSSKGDL